MPGTDDLAARLAALEARVAALEASDAERIAEGRLPEVEALLAQLFGAETVGHFRTARREDLLTMRSMLDRWIERIDRAASKPPQKPPPRRRESISLE